MRLARISRRAWPIPQKQNLKQRTEATVKAIPQNPYAAWGGPGRYPARPGRAACSPDQRIVRSGSSIFAACLRRPDVFQYRNAISDPAIMANVTMPLKAIKPQPGNVERRLSLRHPTERPSDLCCYLSSSVRLLSVKPHTL